MTGTSHVPETDACVGNEHLGGKGREGPRGEVTTEQPAAHAAPPPALHVKPWLAGPRHLAPRPPQPRAPPALSPSFPRAPTLSSLPTSPARTPPGLPILPSRRQPSPRVLPAASPSSIVSPPLRTFCTEPSLGPAPSPLLQFAAPPAPDPQEERCPLPARKRLRRGVNKPRAPPAGRAEMKAGPSDQETGSERVRLSLYRGALGNGFRMNC